MTGPACIYVPPAPPSGVNPADFAAELDREWFDGHPGADQYARLMVPGEFPDLDLGPMSTGCFWAVNVNRIVSGVRTRAPFHVCSLGGAA